MKDKNNKKSILKILKYNFDSITSENRQNPKLILFWIVIFELIASAFEFGFLRSSSSYITIIPESFSKELIIGLLVPGFIWLCIYNFIFWDKKLFFNILLFGFVGVYLIITKDITFNFLLHNIEPMHFFENSFSIALLFELFLKLLITYLFFQLFMSLKKRKCYLRK